MELEETTHEINSNEPIINRHSDTIMTEVVFPNDTNPLGILRGGKMLDWMDTCSAICAHTHANNVAVTASIDSVSFRKSAKLGDIIMVKATITRAYTTSMEVYVEAWARRIPSSEQFLCNEAYYTFVALDANSKPTKVPPFEPITKIEKVRFDQALERYNRRKGIA